MDKYLVDPYVEVSIHVPDWSHAPYIQLSSSAMPSPSSSGSTGRPISRRTNAVKNNGFNPVWQEALSLPFDCVGGMLDLIFVRFAVRRDGDSEEEPIAVYCVSLGSLAMGQYFQNRWSFALTIICRLPTPSSARHTTFPISLLYPFREVRDQLIVPIFHSIVSHIHTQYS